MEYIDYAQEDNESASIQKAIRFVDEHYTEQLTLGEVCKVAMMSKTTFTNSFKRIVGKSLFGYIHVLRVRLAMQLLQDKELNITEISERCGFADSNYFGRLFKKQTEMTPTEFRMIKNENKDVC